MKVRWTRAALADLDQILANAAVRYPAHSADIDARLRAVVTRIGEWPDSARRSLGRPGVRVVPLVRYPFRVFYRTTADAVEILHVHHVAREPWDAET